MTVEPPPADGQSSIPDEVWEQFLNDTEGRIRASAPREPSARARVVAARLRRRAEGQNGEHGENGGNAALRRPSGRSALRPWIGLVVLAVLVLAALNPSAIASWLSLAGWLKEPKVIPPVVRAGVETGGRRSADGLNGVNTGPSGQIFSMNSAPKSGASAASAWNT